MQTRTNRKLAVKWATQQVTTSNVVVSDQYWDCVSSAPQAVAIANNLAKKNILVFAGPGNGAVLVHKRNPNLTVEEMSVASDKEDIQGCTVYAGFLTNKDSTVTLLSPWVLNFAWCKLHEKG